MATEEIVKQLKKLRNPVNIAGMARFGIKPKKEPFGIAMPVLRTLAKDIKHIYPQDRHKLALELWETGIYEARLIASFIEDSKLVNGKQMESWVRGFDNWAICDKHKEEEHEEAEEWRDGAITHLHQTHNVPTEHEVKEAAKQHSSAPLSIWLGIFLDGIPESFVIGAGFLGLLSLKLSHGDVSFNQVVPYTLIAGLFLSNFPESFSSSIGMKKMGWGNFKILSLWISLMLMTAFGAAFGYYYGSVIPHHIEIGIEGLAAGAMLTMIAQTMIPEAVHIGGTKIVGLSTLAGYLSAVGFKVFE